MAITYILMKEDNVISERFAKTNVITYNLKQAMITKNNERFAHIISEYTLSKEKE